jgi:hypothetical protein
MAVPPRVSLEDMVLQLANHVQLLLSQAAFQAPGQASIVPPVVSSLKDELQPSEIPTSKASDLFAVRSPIFGSFSFRLSRIHCSAFEPTTSIPPCFKAIKPGQNWLPTRSNTMPEPPATLLLTYTLLKRGISGSRIYHSRELRLKLG